MKATKQARRQATELFRACQVDGLLDEDRARQAVRQIVAAKPRGFFGTLAYFKRLVALDREKHTARVETAAALPVDLQSRVQEGLTRRYGAGLTTSYADNPALIGGMRIQVGSDVYDGSVRGRLAELARSF